MLLGNCSNKIHCIVRLRQMLRRWRARAASRFPISPPSDVPSGHLAIVVGSARRRYVVKAAYLNHPVFASLLVQAEEEYGFAHPGPLAIPCDESVFEEALSLAARSDSLRSDLRRPVPDEHRSCRHVGSARGYPTLMAESRPLLNGI
ncbi:hypothetical protein SAY87_007335 [Trapa incisa]|uniref:Uncharacterized protein n=1 Tax=Trapa incisa TaxID=236973 RepID=A0AAN7K467_9MYRT|nr:hypothetical protein SAY87_007335 [Trapa incisa]